VGSGVWSGTEGPRKCGSEVLQHRKGPRGTLSLPSICNRRALLPWLPKCRKLLGDGSPRKLAGFAEAIMALCYSCRMFSSTDTSFAVALTVWPVTFGRYSCLDNGTH
jgi:hypothetical protein